METTLRKLSFFSEHNKMSDTKMQINGFYRFSIVMVKYVASGTHVISLMTTSMVYVKQPIQRTGWAKKAGPQTHDRNSVKS